MITLLTRLTEDKNYIYDRATVIDDFVYDFLNEKESTLINYFDIIDCILSRCKIIHLTIDEDIRKKRFEKRGDKYITNDMIKKINNEYQLFYNTLKDDVHYIELSENVDEDIEKIMEVIEDEQY